MTVDLSKLRILGDGEFSRLRSEHPRFKDDSTNFCPTCDKQDVDDYGVCHYKDATSGQRVVCDCAEQLMLYKHYLVAGIGDAYHRLDWRHYTRNKVLAAKVAKTLDNHREYVRRGVGMVFVGPVGSGKTMLCNLMLKEYVKLGYRCHSTSGSEMTTMLTSSWRSVEEKRRFEEVFVRSDVAAIDDLARDIIEDETGEVGKTSKFKENVLDTILRRRVQFARPLLITTNLEAEQLGEAYGPAVESLLMERSIIMSVRGEDFRGEVLRANLAEIEAGTRSPIV